MPRISADFACLALAYALSQFYRAFLAVLSPVLHDELQVTPGELSVSSGLWFATFAAAQIPIGWSLDRFGPRRTVAATLAVGGGGGALIFALSQQTWHLHLAMALLGIGCAPVLMGAYFIFAHSFPAKSFGILAGAIVGFGSLGNILGAAPLVWGIEAIGWRAALLVMVVLTLAISWLVMIWVRDPKVQTENDQKGSMGELLRLRALWFIFPLFFANYAVSASIRGLWVAPYLEQLFGADTQIIGQATLMMGLAMVTGNFLVGPVANRIGSVRRTLLIFTGATLILLIALIFQPGHMRVAIVLLSLIGLSGAAYPLLMTHGRMFLPSHLIGRGVTFLNMVSIGGVGIMQFGSRPIYETSSAYYAPAQAFSLLWLFFMIPLLIGYVLYFWTSEAKHD